MYVCNILSDKCCFLRKCGTVFVILFLITEKHENKTFGKYVYMYVSKVNFPKAAHLDNYQSFIFKRVKI